ncbi:phosphate:Na+ symporter [Acetoanaerobium noterae]|jgi:phosphate:Na+ symporter|uniref:Phosphate:Na+ symporter n=2 Tax=root TaxID=1 RepID=A0A1T5BQC2_9FIRM|nr:Na/Pi cotransporter family protein [Acetoanaerobium noterae]MDK2803753.1 phosphate:Na+ symporter [Peptostreptococcaceae bacterium]SKB49407.1 phosphate:Na+ symporter [Acetoanaerobium noterae]
MYIGIVLGLLAGLGLFLYGMNLMGNGLQKAAGDRLKKIIELLTSNRFIAVLVGIFVTGVIQSSSATTVMVVGFVNAGIMQLNQAIGVIMGANVGTTVTAQLVSFDLEAIAPVAVGIGVIIHMVTKSEKLKSYAEILIGFGILFVGMTYMKDAMSPLREVQAFKDMLVNFGHNPILGILMGFTLTLLVQSSSASIGILLALASQGMLPLEAALPILYGDNIGTCTTALISSIGASKNAQRAAVMHLTFNIIGTLIFALILNRPIMMVVTSIDPTNIARQIANAHTLFNITNVIIQFPFAGLIVKIAERVIPEKPEELELKTTSFIDLRMLNTPSIALKNTIKECLHMGNKAKYSLENSMIALIDKDRDAAFRTFDTEKEINQLERDILEYLIQLSNAAISGEDRAIVDELFNTINDIERVGDHADNIAELSMYFIEKDLTFSEESIKDINTMYEKVMKTYEMSLQSMREGSSELALKVVKMEEQVDIIERSCRSAHIYRLNNSMCNPEAGIIFLDLLSNLERISDHASNIAKAVIDAKGSISA